MPLSWKRTLNRLLVEFFELQLAGVARAQDAIIRFDRDGREIITATFKTVAGRHWKITLKSSEEHPPLGSIHVEDMSSGGGKFADLDPGGFQVFGRFIKEGEHNAAA